MEKNAKEKEVCEANVAKLKEGLQKKNKQIGELKADLQDLDDYDEII